MRFKTDLIDNDLENRPIEKLIVFPSFMSCWLEKRCDAHDNL